MMPQFVEKFEEQPDLGPMAGGPFIAAAGFEDYDCDQRYFGGGIEVSEAVSNQLGKHAAI